MVGDPRPQARSVAVFSLMQLPPTVLSGHKAQLQAIAQALGYDPEISGDLAALIASIP